METPTPAPTPQNIKHDQFDQGKFSHLFYDTELKETLTAGIKDYSQFPELTQDLFYSLFKYAPQFEDEARVQPDFQINRGLIQQAQASQDYAQLRAYTKLNDASAAMAAATLGEAILKENKKQFQQLKEQQKKIQAGKQQLKELVDEVQNQKAQPQTPQTKAILKGLASKIKAKLKQASDAQAAAQKIGGQITVPKAMKETAETIKEQEDMFHSYGGDTPGGPVQHVDINERLKFSKVFIQNNRFRKLIQFMGRMKRLAEKKQKEKIKHSRETIDDIVQSNDISHMVASESLLLCEPDLEILFDKKFVEAQLLTYDLQGQHEKGKGPIVCALDISGSMTGDKDLLAKAIALALVHIAHIQGRDAYVMLFDADIQYYEQFPKDDRAWWEKLLKMTQVFTGGGTSYNPPVEKAMEIFNTEKTYAKADLVIITDMDYGFSEKVKHQFLDMKAARKITCFVIIVDRNYDTIDRHDLKPIADTMTTCQDLSNQVAGDLFEAI